MHHEVADAQIPKTAHERAETMNVACRRPEVSKELSLGEDAQTGPGQPEAALQLTVLERDFRATGRLFQEPLETHPMLGRADQNHPLSAISGGFDLPRKPGQLMDQFIGLAATEVDHLGAGMQHPDPRPTRADAPLRVVQRPFDYVRRIHQLTLFATRLVVREKKLPMSLQGSTDGLAVDHDESPVLTQCRQRSRPFRSAPIEGQREQTGLVQSLGGSLIHRIEGPNRLDLVTEKIQSNRLLESRRENIDDPSAHREVSNLRHQIDPEVSGTGQVRRQRLDRNLFTGVKNRGRFEEQTGSGEPLEKRRRRTDQKT